MIVLRKTMEAAVAAERVRFNDLVAKFGGALLASIALQKQMSAWVMNKAGNITPEQAAQMFYAQDDGWQAAFFNVMQDQIQAHHDALPRDGSVSMGLSPGVPPGEAQWFWMAAKLDDKGFETIEAMYDHAKHARDSGSRSQSQDREDGLGPKDGRAASEGGIAQIPQGKQP